MSSEKKNQDQDAFREAMSGVRPLKPHDRIDPPRRRPSARPEQRLKDDQAALAELMTHEPEYELETGEELLYLRPGLQKRLLRRLRRGYYSVEDSVDLHHMDVATARQVLADFLDLSTRRQYGCVRIIHGKGLRSKNLPRIKMMTNRVLRKSPQVLAFASARPVDGGTGATDVLLTVRRSPRS